MLKRKLAAAAFAVALAIGGLAGIGGTVDLDAESTETTEEAGSRTRSRTGFTGGTWS